MTGIQKLAWIFCVMAIGIVVLGYIPGVDDAQGLMFGLFRIDPIDDVIHGLTGVLAGIAAWHSARMSTWFFRAFGVLYGLDAATGMLFQRGLLDGSVFTQPGGSPGFDMTTLMINLPHIALASIALVVGFILHRRLETA